MQTSFKAKNNNGSNPDGADEEIECGIA